MEAYDQHINKLKVPDIPRVEPHPDSGQTDITAHLVQDGSLGTNVVEDRSKVTNSAGGEFVEERVQIVKTHDLNTPDLTKEEAVISSESSPTSEDEHEIDHVTGEKKKKSKVKKVKSKLASGLRKIFGKKEHHGHEDSHRGHDSHDHPATHVVVEDDHAEHKYKHHHALASIDNTDSVPGYIKLEKETTVMTPATAHSPKFSRLPSSAETSSDRQIQQTLGSAFLAEGQKVARDESTEDTSRNRFESSIGQAEKAHMDIGRLVDLQDHSNSNKPIFPENSNTGIFGSEKYSNPVPANPNLTDIPVLQNKGVEEFSKLRRQSLEQYPAVQRRPSVEFAAHFESVNVRPEAGHLTRSNEEWNLAENKKEEPKLILEDVQRHGKEFSEKFEKVGNHRNSLTGIEPHAYHTMPAVNLVVPSVVQTPSIPIVDKILDPGYERRLSLAREKWSIPVEDRARQLVEETGALLQASHLNHPTLDQRVVSPMTRDDKSDSTFSELSGASHQQPFERVESETMLLESNKDISKQASSDVHVTSPKINLSHQSVSVTPLASEIPARAHLHSAQQVFDSHSHDLVNTLTTGETGAIDRVDAKDTVTTGHSGSLPGQQQSKGGSEFDLAELERFRAATAEFGSRTGSGSEISQAVISLPARIAASDASSDVCSVSSISSQNADNGRREIDGTISPTESKTSLSSEDVVEPEPVAHKGVLNTVVETVAGVVGNVVGMLQAKAAEANATEDEYLPFEVKEKTVDNFQTESEKRDTDITISDTEPIEEPRGLVETVIDKVLTMFTGKEHVEPTVHVEEITIKVESTSKDPAIVLPISGEFIAPLPAETTQNLSAAAVAHGVSIKKTEKTSIASAASVPHPVVN